MEIAEKSLKRATCKDVKSASTIGDAQFKFFLKYNKFPENLKELDEFL